MAKPRSLGFLVNELGLGERRSCRAVSLDGPPLSLWAAVENLAHSASFHASEKIAPSTPGTEHLAARLPYPSHPGFSSIMGPINPPALPNPRLRPHVCIMLHVMKLAVGCRDKAHLQAFQAERVATDPPLRHRTRNMPRRGAEILDGGSIYWAIAGALVVRQRILDIAADRWDDGTACAGLFLDPVLIPVEGRLVKPFQGWRYLPAADAPADLSASGTSSGEAGMPARLRRELQELCLL